MIEARNYVLPFRGRIKYVDENGWPISFDDDPDYVRPIQPRELCEAAQLPVGDITFRVLDYYETVCAVEIEAESSWLDALDRWMVGRSIDEIRRIAHIPMPVVGEIPS